ncbi:MAG: HAD-IA family hydrolase [Eubacteriales bacterium]|nr:HAD-IA family hydrolase [Eubacteriales bacterium]
MDKHLIWDFDGTIYDTYPQMARALVEALADFCCAVNEREACERMKVTLFSAVNIYAEQFGIPADTLMTAFQTHHARQTTLPMMPGLVDCLQTTATMGCRHYLFTHRDQRALAQLAADGLSGFFSDCITRADGFADKPSPQAIFYLMEKQGFAAGNAYMIGDREIDMASGRAAGVGCILFDSDGLTTGARADYRVGSLAEIPTLLLNVQP